jgi:phage recombination protein Bet
MPYKCSKCGAEITEEQVAKTVEKFGNALCNKCILASVEEVEEGAPSAPEEELEQQTHNVGDKSGDDVPMVEHPESNAAVVEYAPKTIPAVIPELDMDTIKTYLCPAATDQEAFMFLRLCQSRGLNPFTNQAYLIKYNQNSKAVMVVGKDTFTERAEQNPNFDGFEAGIIVNCGEKGMHDIIDEREGTLMHEGEELLGGWCKVHRKDHKFPIIAKVSMKEYTQIVKATGNPNAQWTKMPATMIRKVAIVQSLRESFPSDLGGCYDSSEMGAEI